MLSARAMKWPERREGEGWYCTRTSVPCFHNSLASALWHNWSSDGDPRAPWERLRLHRAWRYYVLTRQMGWWMPKMVAAETRLAALLEKHPEEHPEVIAAQQAVDHLKRVKPPLAFE